MVALAADRNTPRRSGDKYNRPVKGGVTIFAGSLVCLDANGFAVPGAAVASLKADGRAESQVINAGADGALSIDVFPGIFRWDNSAAAEALTAADVGRSAFVVDDHTVAKTSAGGTRPVAGVIRDVDSQGVWVEMAEAPASGRTLRLQFAISEADTLAGTSAELISPVAGVISSLSVIVQKAVTTGGNVSALVGATAVAGLVAAVANGAAKGAVVTDTPTVGDITTAVAVNNRIQVLTAGFATAGAVSGYVEIAY